jgi:hypothetical protein
MAIANLLLKSKPAGFALRLLDGLRLRLTVYVTDDPGSSGVGPGTGGGSENGPNYVMGVSGFPPLAEYQFVPEGPGATVLSIGPQTVHYARRMSSPAAVPPLSRSTFAKPSDFDRVQYVNALVRERFEAAPLPAHAQRANVRGTVLVEFTITTEGSVTDARS